MRSPTIEGVLSAQALMPLIFLIIAAPAEAEIKDYEVLRYLYLNTSCGMASVSKIQSEPQTLRFKADCQNRTVFPDGAIVVCANSNDDRSCRVETKGREFKHLRLLQPGRNP